VAVGGTGVAVGGTGVDVGGTGVTVGGSGVAVGLGGTGCAVEVGGKGLGVAEAVGTIVGLGSTVAVGVSDGSAVGVNVSLCTLNTSVGLGETGGSPVNGVRVGTIAVGVEVCGMGTVVGVATCIAATSGDRPVSHACTSANAVMAC